jgi:hypothetical protein
LGSGGSSSFVWNPAQSTTQRLRCANQPPTTAQYARWTAFLGPVDGQPRDLVPLPGSHGPSGRVLTFARSSR